MNVTLQAWSPCHERCQPPDPKVWARPGLTLSPPSLPSASLPQKPSSGSPPLPPGRSQSWRRRSGATGLSRWVSKSPGNLLGEGFGALS